MKHASNKQQIRNIYEYREDKSYQDKKNSFIWHAKLISLLLMFLSWENNNFLRNHPLINNEI